VALFGWIVVILFVIVMALLSVFNLQVVTLHVLPDRMVYEVQLFYVALVPLVVGALVGLVFGLASAGSARRRAREERRRADQLQRQLAAAQRSEPEPPARAPSTVPASLSQTPPAGQLAGPAR